MRIMQSCFFKIYSEIGSAIPKFKDKLKAKDDIFQGYIYGYLKIIQGFIPGNHVNFPCFMYNSNLIFEIYSVVVVDYPSPSEGWGHGGRPWIPRSRETLQGLDQRS